MGLTIKRAVEIVKKEGVSSFSPEAFAAKKVLMGFYKSRTKSRNFNVLTAYSFAYNTSYPKKLPPNAQQKNPALELLAKNIERQPITIEQATQKTDSNKLLFSVGTFDILHAYKKIGIRLDPVCLNIGRPFTEIGYFTFEITLSSTVKATGKLWIVPSA